MTLWQKGGEVVIRFKCIYCGQRILAPDNGAGKKGKCPKCRHELRVPKTTKGRPAISSDKEPLFEHPVLPAQKSVPEKVKPQQQTLNRDTLEIPDDMTEVYEEKLGFLVPTYDELSLFLMAVTLISLYLTNSGMRSEVIGFAMRLEAWRLGIYLALFIVAMFLCLFHVFTPRKKTDIEKGIMLLFAVTMNAASGIIAGLYMWEHCWGWLLIFPIWNFVNSALLILMQYVNVFDENCVADRDATAKQTILGLIAVFVIFIFCNYVFKLHWAITFSICIIYTTSFDKALQSVFPGLANSEDGQNP